jgi:hypothetical protein
MCSLDELKIVLYGVCGVYVCHFRMTSGIKCVIISGDSLEVKICPWQHGAAVDAMLRETCFACNTAVT